MLTARGMGQDAPATEIAKLKQLKRKAQWYEDKANENAGKNEPWSLRNVRLYQNGMSKALGEFYAACKAAGVPPENVS